MSISKFLTCALLAICGMFPAQAAFPDAPITIVVPFAPGGPTDFAARDVAQALGKALKVPVTVEFIGGAGGTVGAGRVVKAKPDGYTLLFEHTGLATLETFYRKLPFSVLNDFEYLGVFLEVPLVLISRPGVPAANYKEMLAWIRANRDRVTVGNAGMGSTSHLCALMFEARIKTPLENISYKGVGPAMSDLLRGHIDLICDQTISATQLLEANRVRAYAVTTPKRLSRPAVLQNTPTLAESGLADFNVTIWLALYAPKGTPPEVLTRLNQALRESLRDPDFVRRQETVGTVPVTDERLMPEGHKNFMKAEMTKWSDAIKASGAAPAD